MSKVTGGGNLTAIYPFTGTTDWGAGVSTTAKVKLVNKFSTAITGHEKSRNLEAAITHEQFDETITDFFAEYLPEVASTEKYEDSTPATIDGPSSAFIAITYSGKSNETTPKRYVRVFPAVLSGGDYTYEADKTVRPSLKISAIKAPADLGVPADCFDTGQIGTAALVTVEAGTFGTSFWATA